MEDQLQSLSQYESFLYAHVVQSIHSFWVNSEFDLLCEITRNVWFITCIYVNF